jgi:hypothetical protein
MNRNPILTALMVIVGVVLLLPGLCAIVFMGAGGIGGGDSSLMLLWIVCFAVSGLGVFLIVRAFR